MLILIFIDNYLVHSAWEDEHLDSDSIMGSLVMYQKNSKPSGLSAMHGNKTGTAYQYQKKHLQSFQISSLISDQPIMA